MFSFIQLFLFNTINALLLIEKHIDCFVIWEEHQGMMSEIQSIERNIISLVPIRLQDIGNYSIF